METSANSKSKNLLLQLEKQKNSEVLNLNDLYLGKHHKEMKAFSN
jgi:hypothetical protein